jgi:hypothetical protein
MFKKNRLLLLLFILYCGDSLWKFGHWHAYMGGLQPWILAIALAVRFTVMAGLLWLYLRANRKSSERQAATGTP